MGGIISAPIGGRVPVSYLGSAVVTVGEYISTLYGFIGILGGSILPQTWASSGLPVYRLYFSLSSDFVKFEVSGVAPNSGWTTLTIGSESYLRTAASYSVGSTTVWQWNTVPPNPFGTTVGATRAITWS